MGRTCAWIHNGALCQANGRTCQKVCHDLASTANLSDDCLIGQRTCQMVGMKDGQPLGEWIHTDWCSDASCDVTRRRDSSEHLSVCLTEIWSHADDDGCCRASRGWRSAQEDKLDRHGTHRCGRRWRIEIFDLQSYCIIIEGTESKHQCAVVSHQLESRGKSRRTDWSTFIIAIPISRWIIRWPSTSESSVPVGIRHLHDVNVLIILSGRTVRSILPLICQIPLPRRANGIHAFP